MFCVYLTIYKGNKLPPFYIGSTSIQKLNKGYVGTVSSKKYKSIWISEKKQNPDLFITRIICSFNNRQQALLRERDLQLALHVVSNTLYANMAYATGKFVNTSCDAETRRKISAAKIGKKRESHSEETKRKMSLSSLGKSKSLAHRLTMSVSKSGLKQTPDTIEKRRNKLIGQKRTTKQCENIKLGKGPTTVERRETFCQAQKLRHENTIVKLKSPSGQIFVGASLEELCIAHNLYHTSMMRTLRSQKPLKFGPNAGWHLIEITK